MYQLKRKMFLKFPEDYNLFKYRLNYFKYQTNYLFTSNYYLNQSYYDILNVPRTATQKEIKDSYLNLCKLYHPDSSTDSKLSKEERVKKFQKINEAYSCLSKLESKKNYDENSPYRNSYYYGGPRRYPRRQDGYYYGRKDFRSDFQNEFQNEFYERYRKTFGDEYREFRRYQQKTSPEELRAIKVVIYTFIFIFIYIFAIRMYVLMTYQNPKKIRNINYDRYYSKIDTNDSNQTNQQSQEPLKYNRDNHPNKEFLRAVEQGPIKTW